MKKIRIALSIIILKKNLSGYLLIKKELFTGMIPFTMLDGASIYGTNALHMPYTDSLHHWSKC